MLDTLVDFQIYLAGSQVPGDSSKLGVADAISTDFWVSEGASAEKGGGGVSGGEGKACEVWVCAFGDTRK